MPLAKAGSPLCVSGKTIGDVLDQTVSTQPDRDALVFPTLKIRWSWAEFRRRVDQVARALMALGSCAASTSGSGR